MYESLEIPPELLEQLGEMLKPVPRGKPHSTELATNAIRKRTRTLSGKAKPYPKLDICIPLDSDLESIKPYVWEVARGLISHWAHLPDEAFGLKQLAGGLTNKLFKVTAKVCGEEQTILVRVYGDKTGKMIDRESEICIVQNLHSQGMCARFYGAYSNGCAYGYVQGRPLSVDDLWNNNAISDAIAGHVGHWHAIVEVSELDHQPTLWRTLRKWVAIVPEDYSHLNATELEKLKAININLKQEVTFLEAELAKLNSPVYFCHSDLTPGNIILNEDTQSIMLIDHEYACYNFRGFDLGNHFCEYLTFDIDLSKYPSRAAQLRFLRRYAEVYKKERLARERREAKKRGEGEGEGESAGGERQESEEVSEEEVEALYREVNQYALASHLFWGVWGLAQSGQVSIEFDYFTYGLRRLTAYMTYRDQFLAL